MCSEHPHHHHDDNKKVLLISFILIFSFMIIEFIGGFLTNSLALISDAGHMLSDSLSLLIAFLAFHFGVKSVTKTKTFGFKRFEILAALFNGVSLIVISIFILIESFERLKNPIEVEPFGMLLVSSLGLFVNIVVAFIMHKKSDVENNLNMKGAYLHVLADMLGSVAAIFAAISIIFFEFHYGDIIASSLVAILIVRSGIKIAFNSVHILMEGTPHNIEFDDVLNSLKNFEEIRSIHDLHIWSLSSNENALSCHIVVDEKMSISESQKLQDKINLSLLKFFIIHSSIQFEIKPCSNQLLCVDAQQKRQS